MKHNKKRRSAKAGTSRHTGSPQKLQKVAKKREYDSIDMRLNVSDILDALPLYVLLIDEEHRILQANKAVQAQLGVKPKAIIGKYCPQAIHGLDEPWYACPLEEAVQKDRVVEREALDHKSGRWIRSAVYPTGRLTRDGKMIFFHMVSDITDRKQAEEQLRVSREQLRDLSAHLESIREEERTKQAREIHDELGSLLTGLKIDVSWLAKRAPKEQESLLDKIKSMQELIDSAIQTVKRISAELRPGVLDDLGLSAAIEWQAQEFEKRTELRVEFKSSPKEITLDQDRSTAIFRICQEALTNVVRHANATRVKLSLQEKRGIILLRISDNGKGIEEKQLSDPKAFGLIGMRERARFWRGETKIRGIPGKGTIVAVSIPLKSGKFPDAENINS
jgi:PAS domain S-box-containing protein